MATFILVLLLITPTVAQTRVKATAPVSDIEEGSILSLHCQVWELQKSNQEVTLLRTIGRETQRLSLDEGLHHDVDDRTFLATRHLGDGSIVYFLTIIDVKRDDSGRYTCKVHNKTGRISEVDGDYVDLNIMYFPADSDPVCQPQDSSLSRVKSGTSIQLNCSSEISIPPVLITWVKASSSKKQLKSTSFEQNGRLYSQLTVTLGPREQNAIFICRVTSNAFVDREQTCHIGPFSVIVTADDGSNYDTPNNPKMIPPVGDTSQETVEQSEDGQRDRDPVMTSKKTRCEKTCNSYFESPVNRWIMATVVAGLLTFIFFILGIALFYKYYQVHSSQYIGSRRIQTRLYSDDIYSELEARRPDLYMALDKHGIMDTRLQTQPCQDMPEHYHVLPKQVN